jgi:hypothetical protein
MWMIIDLSKVRIVGVRIVGVRIVVVRIVGETKWKKGRL